MIIVSPFSCMSSATIQMSFNLDSDLGLKFRWGDVPRFRRSPNCQGTAKAGNAKTCILQHILRNGTHLSRTRASESPLSLYHLSHMSPNEWSLVGSGSESFVWLHPNNPYSLKHCLLGQNGEINFSRYEASESWLFPGVR